MPLPAGKIEGGVSFGQYSRITRKMVRPVQEAN